jgi:hypothetical protein
MPFDSNQLQHLSSFQQSFPFILLSQHFLFAASSPSRTTQPTHTHTMRSALRTASTLASTSFARPVLAKPIARPIVAQGFNVVKRSYHEKVIDHYENPRNVSVLLHTPARRFHLVWQGLCPVTTGRCGELWRERELRELLSGLSDKVKTLTRLRLVTCPKATSTSERVSSAPPLVASKSESVPPCIKIRMFLLPVQHARLQHARRLHFPRLSVTPLSSAESSS